MGDQSRSSPPQWPYGAADPRLHASNLHDPHLHPPAQPQGPAFPGRSDNSAFPTNAPYDRSGLTYIPRTTAQAAQSPQYIPTTPSLYSYRSPGYYSGNPAVSPQHGHAGGYQPHSSLSTISRSVHRASCTLTCLLPLMLTPRQRLWTINAANNLRRPSTALRTCSTAARILAASTRPRSSSKQFAEQSTQSRDKRCCWIGTACPSD